MVLKHSPSQSPACGMISTFKGLTEREVVIQFKKKIDVNILNVSN
jgi:hypothetical protein